MADSTAEIAIVGAGPSGAHLAARLADAGRDVVLFDPKGAWEKPCGGGVPTRAIKEFAFLLDDSKYPRKAVNRITMISPVGRRVTLKVEEPFVIYSREVLNGLVLDRAISAGARFVRAGVKDFSRAGDGWNILTDDGGRWSARFLVGADGAASFTRRRLVGIFPKQDLALAFGYNVEDACADAVNASGNGNDKPVARAEADEAIVSFPRDFTGYLWAFPRPGVMNFGVASKLGERTSDDLRAALSDFVRDYYGGRMPEAERTSFFGAKIPTLDLASWKGLRTGGEGWALVGDAAGFADPITGEGIYYAFKSADILADALIGDRGRAGMARQGRAPRSANFGDQSDGVGVCGNGGPAEYNGAVAAYDKLWRGAFGRELEHASYRLPQFYHSRFFGHIFTDAMIGLARHHRGVRT
ncbi:MAG TPA: NAD(P)-binding protein, partial [Blastocatellia bacterium]